MSPLPFRLDSPSRIAIAAVAVIAAMSIFLWLVDGAPFGAQQFTYYVSPNGDDTKTGLSVDQPFRTIQQAVDMAQPGDHILLADGDYPQAFHSVRDGRQHLPITIKGSNKAVVRGTLDYGRVIDITHDYLTLDGFTVNGASGQAASKADFRDKLIYAIGNQSGNGVRGLVITRMVIQNAGGECVRLRYFAQDNEVSYSTIRNCGIYDFRFKDGGKNGEGIYIGTAPEQRADGKNPTADVDASQRNHIHHNTIETHGNECVDVKEGSRDNVVEHNTCRFQLDPESAGLDARGNHNIFRFNTVTDNVGSGVRLGGDTDEDGINNSVYNNTLSNNQAGAIKIIHQPQTKICGNNLSNNGGSPDKQVGSQPCQ